MTHLELQAAGEDGKAGWLDWVSAVCFSAAARLLRSAQEGGPVGSCLLPTPFVVHLCAGVVAAAGA